MEKAYKYLLDRGYDDVLEEADIQDTISVEQIQALIDNYSDFDNKPYFDNTTIEDAFDTGYDLGVAMTLACGKEKY
jgi:hypothetical protein